MKSIVVTAIGGPEVLELRDVSVPDPDFDEVLIKVRAAGINYADIMQREGLYPGGPKAPFGAGFEVAGVIERIGRDMRQWSPGDEVMAFCQSGYSEYVTAKAWQVMPKPTQLSFSQAAAIPCQYLTAYHALLTLGGLASGQTVLIQAAAGGLGTQLVQIARNVGATVFGTASTPEKCALIESLGCHHTINYTAQDFVAEVKRITDGHGCDLVIESVGGEVFDKSLKCLKTRGMLVTLGAASKQPPTVNAVQLLANNWTVAGIHLMAYTADTIAMASAIRDLHTWLMEDKLQVIVGHEFPLEQAAEAQRMISERKTSGKVVLVP
jgi:NADPH2:quinone reductase